MPTPLDLAANLTGAAVTQGDAKIWFTGMRAALAEIGDPLGRPGAIQNLSLDFGVGSSALTINVKTRAGNTPSAVDPVSVAMRNATLATGNFTVRNIMAALSLVVPSTATLGHTSAVAGDLYHYLIDNAGALEYAVSMKYFGKQGIVSTTTIAGGSNSATTMYSATGRSNVAFRCIGHTIDTQTTAGTWAAVPSTVELEPFDQPTATGVVLNRICDGRLTLTTGTPITVGDVTAAGTVFFTPFKGSTIATYNGSSWSLNTFTEKSVAVPATTSTPFDVFIVDGTLALETVNWTNDTTRATALVIQDGILVKSGATTRRYLGTGRTTTVSGQTEDSIAKRYLWNYYNRVVRKMLVQEATSTWNYTIATYRQANGSVANQLDMVIGVSEDPVKANVASSAVASGSGAQAQVGIGIDSTTVNGADLFPLAVLATVTTTLAHLSAQWSGYPGIGRHFLAWLEISVAGGTTTWEGNNPGSIGGANTHSGIAGELMG